MKFMVDRYTLNFQAVTAYLKYVEIVVSSFNSICETHSFYVLSIMFKADVVASMLAFPRLIR